MSQLWVQMALERLMPRQIFCQAARLQKKIGEIKPPQVSNATTSENEEFAGTSECESCVIEERVQNKGEVHSKGWENQQGGSPVSVKRRLQEHLSFWLFAVYFIQF